MGNRYNSKQTGIQGPGAGDNTIIMNQAEKIEIGSINSGDFAKELEALVNYIKENKNKLDSFNQGDIPLLNEAKEEAQNGNVSNAIEKLKKTGRWVFEVAKLIGVPILIELIKQSTFG